ncbi:unnamed protein product, partial [Linum tenue]
SLGVLWRCATQVVTVKPNDLGRHRSSCVTMKSSGVANPRT